MYICNKITVLTLANIIIIVVIMYYVSMPAKQRRYDIA